MSVYKFKVMYDEDENIYREIEVRPANSFMEFEEMIVSAWGLPNENEGKFFTSNDRGQKLKTFNHKKPVKSGDTSFYPMILHFVDHPHQVFLYETTGKQDLAFVIELVIINAEKPERSYPFMVKSNGPSPVKKEDVYKHMASNSIQNEEVEGIDEEEDVKLLKGFGTEGEDVETGSSSRGSSSDDDAGDDDDEFAQDDEEEEGGEDGEDSYGSGGYGNSGGGYDED